MYVYYACVYVYVYYAWLKPAFCKWRMEVGAMVPVWLQDFYTWRDAPLQVAKSGPKKVLQPFLKRWQQSQRMKVAKLKKHAKAVKRINTLTCGGDSLKIIENE